MLDAIKCIRRRLASSHDALLATLAAFTVVFTPSHVLAQGCDALLHSWEGIPFDSSLNPRRHPPDPHGAAGPQGVLAAVNIRLTYYAKDGTPTWGPVCLRDFFSVLRGGCVPNVSGGTFPANWSDFVTDPRALYDPASQRFYVIIAEEYMVNTDPASSHSYLHVAVSRSSNPTTADASSWIVHQMDITSVLNGCRIGDDYPGLAVDGQALYVTYNPADLGDVCDPPPPNPIHVISIDKASLLTSQPAWTMTYTPEDASTLVPVSVLGVSSPGNVAYFAELGGGTSPSIRLWALSDPLGAGRSFASALVPVPAIGGIASAPQPTPCNPLDTRSGWPQGNAFWHDGALRLVATGAANGRAQVSYFKIATNGFPNGTPSLVETENLAGNDAWYQPAIGGNARGDEGIVFTRSSATEPPSIWFAWRRNGDSTFRGPVSVKSSPTCYAGPPTESVVRWGDYATVSADPTDQSFWLSHEWAKGSGEKEWGTWWAHLAPCPTPISDLVTAYPTGRHTVILRWTEPAYAASYDLRYSTSTITDANFENCDTLASTPAPTGIAGTLACFTAYNLLQCRTYYFALKWKDSSGLWSGISNVASGTTRCSGYDVMCADDGLMTYTGPEETFDTRMPASLESPKPTPSVSSAELRYQVGTGLAGSELELAVFDLAGRRLRTLERQAAAPGTHQVVWDLAAADGRKLEPGTYFVRLRVGAWSQSRTLLLVR